MNNEMTLIDRWEDFGMNYRGRWVPTNIYDEKDVVWIDLDEEKTLGSESYFVCREEHIAEDEFDPKMWELYGKGRVRTF